MEAVRKYALIKVRAGDYLLPDNDGEQLWRISQYEDGPTHGLVDMERDVTLWGFWRWADRFSTPQTADDPTDWGYWEMVDGWCETREEAIQRALQYHPRRSADPMLSRAIDTYNQEHT